LIFPFVSYHQGTLISGTSLELKPACFFSFVVFVVFIIELWAKRERSGSLGFLWFVETTSGP
jgi:hypothetical protein